MFSHRALGLVLLSALLLTLLIVGRQETHRPWKQIQQKSSPAPAGVKELYLPHWRTRERCLTCHFGIEEISSAHPVQSFGCTICHGGNGLALDKDLAHQGLLGGANPADFRVVHLTCGRRAPDGTRCHSGHGEPEKNTALTAPRSLMASMAGVIAGLRYTWGAQDTPEARYGAVGVRTPEKSLAPIPVFDRLSFRRGADGRALTKDDLGNEIAVSGQLADDHWRKFCSRCHLYSERPSGPSAHGGGCASCHVVRNTAGTYEGGDVSLPRNKVGYGRQHRLSASPPVSQCLRCHNRSGRIGLTYSGLLESDQYGTPYQSGDLHKSRLSGGRFVQHLTPDIHFEKGMHCIDCHLAREIMGDGRIYSRMYQAVEIRCEDCHGTEKKPPRTVTVLSDKDPVIWLAANQKLPPIQPGELLLTSSRGQPFSNIRREKDQWVLFSKVDGRRHPLKIITARPGPHAFPGHGSERMECFSCHTRWAPQCYGCHDYRRSGDRQLDVMNRVSSPGAWLETRDYYRFEDPPLGRNQRRKVSPFVPGCQVLLTELDSQGRPLEGRARKIFRRPGFNGIVAGPLQPHAVRREVRSCPECHGNPKALGLGSGLLLPGSAGNANRHLSPFRGEPEFPHSWEALIDPEGRPLQSTSRPGARPFNRKELIKIRRVAPCLPCHDTYQDPIYRDPEQAYRVDRGEKHRRIVREYQKDLP
ncbi:MAG: hypothetical protein HY892_13875 [Deltaproteobacteria bacterium]|nr:hypothetical protein [Deltaproteobacteria bacterium]